MRDSVPSGLALVLSIVDMKFCMLYDNNVTIVTCTKCMYRMAGKLLHTAVYKNLADYNLAVSLRASVV